MNANLRSSAGTIEKHILSLLEGLPPESLTIIEQFAQFLHEQARLGKPFVGASATHPYRYPTQPLPASALDGLIGIMPAVGGDGLADTEALYDRA